MKIILQCLAIAVGLAAFLPLIRSDVWWIRGFDFPRIQLLAAGVGLLVALAILGVEPRLIDGGTVAFLMLGIAVQAWWMRRYSKLAPCQVLEGAGEGEPGLSVLIANVLMANRDADRLLDLIRQQSPDVVIAVEIDQWWVEQLRKLGEEYPHAVEVPQENTYGMAIRSRLPLIETSVECLVRKNIPSIHTRVRLADGDVIHLHAVHPKPPFPDEDTSTTDRDSELLVVGERVEEHGGPTIVAGDLNDVAWSRTTRLFQKISGLLDPRVGRGCFNTYHAGHWWLRWPLDHVFLSDHFRLRRLEIQRSIGSDHFPILADLSYQPGRREQQSAPPKSAEDQQEAREKISESTGTKAESARSRLSSIARHKQLYI